MDAALVLRSSFNAWRVSNAGCPTIGGMVGCGKRSMILSAVDMIGVQLWMGIFGYGVVRLWSKTVDLNSV